LGGLRASLPDEEFLVPLGKSKIVREGSDVTLVAIAGAVPAAKVAAEKLQEGHKISVEVIDPRTLVPLDKETILSSAARTGRLVIVDPACRTCSAASEIAAIAAEEIFSDLLAPIVRITAPDLPVPFAPVLERTLYPTADLIIAEVLRSASIGRGRRSAAAG
jgi:pyruvate/2-oxoglutarate/acetoin dehydrogenase E1 component